MAATRKSSPDVFLAAREFLFHHRTDYESAYAKLRWPELDRFNWALDCFDVYAAGNCHTDSYDVLQ